EAAGLIRGLVERIVLTPSADGTRLVVDLEGDLAGILAVAAGEDRKAKDSETTSIVALDAAEAVASRTFRLPAAHEAAVVGIDGCGRVPSSIPRATEGVAGIAGCGGRI
ncbi:MAG: hypothetical protein AAFZ06_16790, partial [Pseudomonadota bacterium]